MSSSGASLVSALYALPARQREALVLRYLADLPDSQIAFVMGVGTRSASNYVERGTACLQAVLEGGQLPAERGADGFASLPAGRMTVTGQCA